MGPGKAGKDNNGVRGHDLGHEDTCAGAAQAFSLDKGA